MFGACRDLHHVSWLQHKWGNLLISYTFLSLSLRNWQRHRVRWCEFPRSIKWAACRRPNWLLATRSYDTITFCPHTQKMSRWRGEKPDPLICSSLFNAASMKGQYLYTCSFMRKTRRQPARPNEVPFETLLHYNRHEFTCRQKIGRR